MKVEIDRETWERIQQIEVLKDETINPVQYRQLMGIIAERITTSLVIAGRKELGGVQEAQDLWDHVLGEGGGDHATDALGAGCEDGDPGMDRDTVVHLTVSSGGDPDRLVAEHGTFVIPGTPDWRP